jgi:precorrin-6B methylase 2
MSTQPSNPTPQRIHEMTWGFAAPLMLQTAIELKLFDRLEGHPQTALELSKQVGASERGVRILCNALVSIGFLTKTAAGRLELTPESAAFLVTSKPSFQGGLLCHIGHQLLPKWSRLTQVVRNGKPVRDADQKHDAEFFAAFVEDLFPFGYPAARALAEALKVADAKQPVQVLDIAAGSGVWSIALAEKSPQVRITAVDWPPVAAVTRKVAQQHNVADRLRTIEGDMHQVPLEPNHYHIATLGQILHGEGIEDSKKLLKRVFDALAPGGTIAIAEFLADDNRTGPPMPLLFAVNMLVNTDQGDTFTFGEISNWLTDIGYTHPRLLPVPAVSPMILADKPM